MRARRRTHSRHVLRFLDRHRHAAEQAEPFAPHDGGIGTLGGVSCRIGVNHRDRVDAGVHILGPAQAGLKKSMVDSSRAQVTRRALDQRTT